MRREKGKMLYIEPGFRLPAESRHSSQAPFTKIEARNVNPLSVTAHPP